MVDPMKSTNSCHVNSDSHNNMPGPLTDQATHKLVVGLSKSGIPT